MTLLSVVQDVCVNVGVMYPTSVFPGIATNRTMQEMVSLANEMAQRMAYDTREWTVLKTSETFDGDGVTTAWDLPENFKRMLLTAEVWRSTSSQQPMMFVPDANQWLQRRTNQDTDTWGEWTMMGGKMHIYPALGVDQSATFAYLDKHPIKLGTGGTSDVFITDADTYLLGDRLLKLGMIWQWKAYKGVPYAEDMGTWTDALGIAMGTDSPAPILISRTPLSANARIAMPTQTIIVPP